MANPFQPDETPDSQLARLAAKVYGNPEPAPVLNSTGKFLQTIKATTAQQNPAQVKTRTLSIKGDDGKVHKFPWLLDRAPTLSEQDRLIAGVNGAKVASTWESPNNLVHTLNQGNNLPPKPKAVAPAKPPAPIFQTPQQDPSADPYGRAQDVADQQANTNYGTVQGANTRHAPDLGKLTSNAFQSLAEAPLRINDAIQGGPLQQRMDQLGMSSQLQHEAWLPSPEAIGAGINRQTSSPALRAVAKAVTGIFNPKSYTEIASGLTTDPVNTVGGLLKGTFAAVLPNVSAEDRWASVLNLAALGFGGVAHLPEPLKAIFRDTAPKGTPSIDIPLYSETHPVRENSINETTQENPQVKENGPVPTTNPEPASIPAKEVGQAPAKAKEKVNAPKANPEPATTTAQPVASDKNSLDKPPQFKKGDVAPQLFHAGPQGLSELNTSRELIDAGKISVEQAQSAWRDKWGDDISENNLLSHPTMNEVSFTPDIEEAKRIAHYQDGHVYVAKDVPVTRINEEGYPTSNKTPIAVERYREPITPPKVTDSQPLETTPKAEPHPVTEALSALAEKPTHAETERLKAEGVLPDVNTVKDKGSAARWIKEATEAGMIGRAESIAQAATEHDRPLTASEQAAIYIKANRITDQLAKLRDASLEAAKAGDATKHSELGITIKDLEDRGTLLHNALYKQGGSRTAQTLGSRAQLFKDADSQSSLVQKLAAERGPNNPITKTHISDLGKIADEIQAAKSAAATGEASRASRTPAVRYKRTVSKETYEQAVKRFQSSGVGKIKTRGSVSLKGTDWEDLKTIVKYHVEGGISTLADLADKVASLAIPQERLQKAYDEVNAELRPKEKPPTLVSRMKRAASNQKNPEYASTPKERAKPGARQVAPIKKFLDVSSKPNYTDLDNADSLREKAAIESARQKAKAYIEYNTPTSQLRKSADRIAGLVSSNMISSPMVVPKIVLSHVMNVADSLAVQPQISLFKAVFGKSLGEPIGATEGFSGKATGKLLMSPVTKATWQGVWDNLAKGQSALQLVSGHGEYTSPLNWDKNTPALTKGLDIYEVAPRRLHGATQSFAMYGEFMSQLEKEKAQALNEGKNLNDPQTKVQITMDAAQHAAMASFQNETWLSNKLRSILKPFGFAGRVLSPVVRIPVNHELRALEHVPVIGQAAAFTKHISSVLSKEPLTRPEAASIARAYARGGLGAGMLWLTLTRPDIINVPPLYTAQNKGRGVSEPISLFGHPLPTFISTLGKLSPLMQGVAFARTLIDGYTRANTGIDTDKAAKLDTGHKVVGALGNAAYMLADQTPVVSTAKEVLEDTGKSGESLMTAIGNQVAQRVVPQAVQWAARATDTNEGQTVKRKPQGMSDAFKMTTPGLRQQVAERNPGLSLSTVKELDKVDYEVKAPVRVPRETDAQYRQRTLRRNQDINRDIQRLLKKGSYLKLSDKDRHQMVKETISQ